MIEKIDEAKCAAAVDLYWLPLGAGGHSVRYNGRAYEALVARKEGRRARELYHSALQVELGQESYVIEQAPVPDLSGDRERGVVAGGAVGARWAARLRTFRYEIRLALQPSVLAEERTHADTRFTRRGNSLRGKRSGLWG